MQSVNNFIFLRHFFYGFIGSNLNLLLFITFFASLMEGFGFFLLLPLIEVLDLTEDEIRHGNLSVHFISSIFIYMNLTKEQLSFFLLFGIASAFSLKGLINYLCFSFIYRLRAQLLYQIKSQLVSRLITIDSEDFDKNRQGYFVNIIGEQSTKCVQSFHNFNLVGVSLLSGFIYLSIVIWLALPFGLMSLAAAIFVFLIFLKLNSRVQKLSLDTSKETEFLSDWSILWTNAMGYIKGTGSFRNIYPVVNQAVQKISQLERKRGQAAALTLSLKEPLVVLLVLATVTIQISLFEASVAEIMVVLALFYRSLSNFLAAQVAWQTVMDTFGGVKYTATELSEVNTAEVDRLLNQSEVLEVKDIDLKEVCWKPNSAEELILKNINFSLKQGDSLALLGPSGSGKSSLLKLISMVNCPSSGSFRINGIEVASGELFDSQISLGYVEQQPAIFTGSVYDNITMFENNLSSEEIDRIIKVSEMAQVNEFVELLFDGYDTILGVGGVQLSGGQKQRLALARELYRDPTLLILDEATSALDLKTSTKVLDNLMLLSKSKIIIFATHQESLVSYFNKAILIEQGRIVDENSV